MKSLPVRLVADREAVHMLPVATPDMPGGLGVTEGTMASLLKALGGPAMTLPVATATTILVRIATLWFAVGIGLVLIAGFIAGLLWALRWWQRRLGHVRQRPAVQHPAGRTASGEAYLTNQ